MTRCPDCGALYADECEPCPSCEWQDEMQAAIDADAMESEEE